MDQLLGLPLGGLMNLVIGIVCLAVIIVLFKKLQSILHMLLHNASAERVALAEVLSQLTTQMERMVELQGETVSLLRESPARHGVASSRAPVYAPQDDELEEPIEVEAAQLHLDGSAAQALRRRQAQHETQGGTREPSHNDGGVHVAAAPAAAAVAATAVGLAAAPVLAADPMQDPDAFGESAFAEPESDTIPDLLDPVAGEVVAGEDVMDLADSLREAVPPTMGRQGPGSATASPAAPWFNQTMQADELEDLADFDALSPPPSVAVADDDVESPALQWDVDDAEAFSPAGLAQDEEEDLWDQAPEILGRTGTIPPSAFTPASFLQDDEDDLILFETPAESATAAQESFTDAPRLAPPTAQDLQFEAVETVETVETGPGQDEAPVLDFDSGDGVEELVFEMHDEVPPPAAQAVAEAGRQDIMSELLANEIPPDLPGSELDDMPADMFDELSDVAATTLAHDPAAEDDDLVLEFDTDASLLERASDEAIAAALDEDDLIFDMPEADEPATVLKQEVEEVEEVEEDALVFLDEEVSSLPTPPAPPVPPVPPATSAAGADVGPEMASALPELPELSGPALPGLPGLPGLDGEDGIDFEDAFDLDEEDALVFVDEAPRGEAPGNAVPGEDTLGEDVLLDFDLADELSEHEFSVLGRGAETEALDASASSSAVAELEELISFEPTIMPDPDRHAAVPTHDGHGPFSYEEQLERDIAALEDIISFEEESPDSPAPAPPATGARPAKPATPARPAPQARQGGNITDFLE